MNFIKKIPVDKSLYIVTNFIVSAVGFIRSFIFMREFDMKELGILTLIQTVILFVAMLQFGFINGGYRIFSLKIEEQNVRINNFLFSFFGIISFILIVCWAILSICGRTLNLSSTFLLVAIITGIMSLVQTWLTNTLIAKQLLSLLNKINLISSFLSLLAVFSILFLGFTGALITLFSLPVSFILLALILCKELRPTAFLFKSDIAKYILKYGFIPFVAGITVLLNAQVERWSINYYLGLDKLGNFYLVFIYSTLFILLPVSLLNIFFPRCIYSYQNKEIPIFKKLLVKHLILLLIYCVFIVLFSILFLQDLVQLCFPAHSNNVIYVFFYLPGLVALVLCDPISLILNASVRLQPILWAGITSVILNCLLIYIANYFNHYNLEAASVIKSTINIYILAFYVVYVTYYWKRIMK